MPSRALINQVMPKPSAMDCMVAEAASVINSLSFQVHHTEQAASNLADLTFDHDTGRRPAPGRDDTTGQKET